MNPNVVAAYALLGRLRDHGVTHAVISPGSRSTALAYAAHKILNTTVVIDERDAGFIALGISESSNRPAVIITTSGSAPTHLYPSIVEAFNSNIGLIVLSADRPHEIRGRGAPQTIDQINLYSSFVKYFCDSACPHDEVSENYWHVIADDLMQHADMSKRICGPVHLNMGMREPLIPDGDEELPSESAVETEKLVDTKRSTIGFTKSANENEVVDFSNLLSNQNKVLITLGRFFKGDLNKLFGFADQLHAPVLGDVLSNTRHHEEIITNYDAIARTNDEALFPDVIFQFGEPLTSKNFNQLYGDKAKVIRISTKEDNRNPYGHQDHSFSYDSFDVFFENTVLNVNSSEDFLHLWKEKKNEADEQIKSLLAHNPDSEPAIMTLIGETFSNIKVVFSVLLASSMPIRYGEWFWSSISKSIEIYSHRGTNGIDGMLASALGISLGSNKATIAVIGDVAFSHNLGFLPHIHKIAANKKVSLAFIVIDNGGGAIFSHLDQAKSQPLSESYNELFNTSPHINLAAIASAVNVKYQLAEGEKIIETLQQHMNAQPIGVTIFHIKCESKSGYEFMSKLDKKLLRDID